MSILLGIAGIMSVLGLAYLLSNDKNNINIRAVVVMIALQFASILFMFKTAIGAKVIEAVAGGVAKLMSYGYEGISFVTGGLVVEEGGSVFFINVLMIIIFTSTLLSLLTHIKVLPVAIKYIGGGLAKITGLPKVESFNAVNSIFFGQSESLLAIKSHIGRMNDNRLFIVSTSAMASVSASIVGAYMTMLEPKYVLTAMILNMLSGLIVASIVAPVKADQDEQINIKDIQTSDSFFGALSQGALDGGKVALIVASMLVAYVGLIALVNGIFTGLFGVDVQTILGYILYPVTFLMGVPTGEILQAGSIMGTKIAANEFVAMINFMNVSGDMSAKAVGIVSTFLVSFANFSSIGIISGSVQVINGEKASVVAKFGLKMLLVATMVSVLSATIVGLFI